jgi:outer membrane protein OmpA-like peptidoglycan-associated protein
MTKKISTVALVSLLAISLVSCAALDTKTKQGTAVGAGTGAIIGAALGQAIGGNTKSTLWGAAIGTVVGGIAGHQVGSYMDRQEAALRSATASSDAVSIARSQDVLVATFKSGVLFDFDSSVIKPGGQAELDRVARVLNQYPQTVLQVEGHTDSTGSEEYNLRLSQRRADAVKNALIAKGINPQRVVAIGFGETMPVSSDNAQNRRVSISIIPVESVR